jgi:ligand-binding sensor domain-containing protein
MMKRITYTVILIICLATACKKDKPATSIQPNGPTEPDKEWVVYNTTNSTLPNDQVNALAIDKSDTKWVGTANGLVHITGNTWTIFNPGSSPLPSAYITALAVQNDGTIWVGTDKGLARYNKEGWAVYNTGNSLLTDNLITCLAYDARLNIVWAGTGMGFYKISNARNWERFSELENQIIYSIAADNNGAIWLGTFNHIAFKGRIIKFDNDKFTTINLHNVGYTSTHPYSIAIDKSNRPLVVLTGTTTKAVVMVNGIDLEEIIRPETAYGLKTILLEGNKIWVGGKTLNIFGDKTAPNIVIPGTDANIQAMAIDSKGRKWLGTIYGGVAVYNDHIKPL